MKDITLRVAQLRTAVEFLAEAAFNRGGYDNISVIIVSHD